MNRNRLLLVAGAIGAAALLAVVLIVAVGNKSSSTTTTPVTTESSGPATAEQPFGTGIPQRGDTIGKPSAPATLTVYEDPQCPYCRDWDVNTLPAVISQFVRPGKIKLVYRGINIVGPNSDDGLRAIYAAGAQNKLWNLATALYARQGAENSGWITRNVLLTVAADASANGPAILARMSSAAVTAQLRQAEQHATADQVRGTPTFVLERPPAVPQQLTISGLDPTSFVSALSAALQ